MFSISSFWRKPFSLLVATQFVVVFCKKWANTSIRGTLNQAIGKRGNVYSHHSSKTPLVLSEDLRFAQQNFAKDDNIT